MRSIICAIGVPNTCQPQQQEQHEQQQHVGTGMNTADHAEVNEQNEYKPDEMMTQNASLCHGILYKTTNDTSARLAISGKTDAASKAPPVDLCVTSVSFVGLDVAMCSIAHCLPRIHQTDGSTASVANMRSVVLMAFINWCLAHTDDLFSLDCNLYGSRPRTEPRPAGSTATAASFSVA
jgi:hypothetical protein